MIEQNQQTNTKRAIPYFTINAADFIVYSTELSQNEIIEVITAVSKLCMFGKNNFKPKNEIQKLWYEKLANAYDKNYKKYISSVENGKKGGRPKTEKKPTGFLQDNPNKTDGETNIIEYNIIEYNNKEDNINLKNNISIENDFFNLYNSTVKNLPLIKKLSTSRKKKIKTRLKELPLEDWKKVFEKCDNSDFCCGKNNRNWKASFDWLIENDNNYIKVLEGKYDNKQQTTDKNKVLEIMRQTLGEQNEQK